MPWFLVAILSYFLLAAVFLADKWLLVGPISSPKIYAFYIGILQILVFPLIFFVDFVIPEPFQIILAIASGFFFILALYWFYRGLQIFEPSRIVPAVGGFLPIFILIIIYLISGGKDGFTARYFLSFFLLIFGSILLTYERSKIISLQSIKISIVTAILFAFYSILAKYAYMGQPFWSGFIWIRAGSFLTAILFLFLFKKEILNEILKKPKIAETKKNAAVFFINQGVGAGANILNNWAIALAPLAFVPIVSALQGTQYVFLLFFSVFLSLKFPQILKEEISRRTLLQKVAAILLIGAGLAILAIKS